MNKQINKYNLINGKLVFQEVDREGLSGDTSFKQGLEEKVRVSWVGHCENHAKQTQKQVQSPRWKCAGSAPIGDFLCDCSLDRNTFNFMIKYLPKEKRKRTREY